MTDSPDRGNRTPAAENPEAGSGGFGEIVQNKHKNKSFNTDQGIQPTGQDSTTPHFE